MGNPYQLTHLCKNNRDFLSLSSPSNHSPLVLETLRSRIPLFLTHRIHSHGRVEEDKHVLVSMNHVMEVLFGQSDNSVLVRILGECQTQEYKCEQKLHRLE